MATYLGQTPLFANTFLAGCDSIVMINISAAPIHLLPSSLKQMGSNKLVYAAVCRSD
jgi:hypothetical protein